MSVSLFTAGLLFSVAQFLAALPWLAALDWRTFKAQSTKPAVLGYTLAGLLGAGLAGGFLLSYAGDPVKLEFYGRIYALGLHLQLIVDLFVVVFVVLLAVWPKGGTVALAAFREGYRQPMFWLLFLFTFVLLFASMVIPYFTFGDDYKMMKQIGFDMIMLAAVLFAVLAASISINEEIEGRTAVTLMSKPVTRRHFLLGKYLGILLAAGLMTLILGATFNLALWIKPYFDRLDDAVDPMPEEMRAVLAPRLEALVPGVQGKAFVRGNAIWLGDTVANSLGLLLGFGQVMVLLAIAATLATRLPMVANLVVCLVVFFLGHLAPVLVQVSAGLGGGGATNPLNLIGFLAQLFETLMPALGFFNNSSAIIRDNPLAVRDFAAYVGSVTAYAVVYSTIALLFGLILFEDRDLA